MRIRASMADSIMYAAGETRNYTRILALADSLEALGDLTQVNANRWRGVAYFYQGQNRTSEFYYKKAVADGRSTGLWMVMAVIEIISPSTMT